MFLDVYNTNNLHLLKIGGAITGNSEQIALRYFNTKHILGKQRNVIVVSSYLKEKLLLEEYQAICYHEEGHYVLRHNVNNSNDWKTKELEADAYASSKVGARNVFTALMKVPAIIRTCVPLRQHGLKTKTDEEYRIFINNFLNEINQKMQYRYNALEKLF